MTASAPAPEKLPEGSIWSNRPFMLLWTAQAISQTAQNAIWFALMVLIEETTHSTAQLGIAIVSYILPSIFFTVPAGVLVDRVDKRTVLVATNWLRAVVVLGYVVFSHTLPVVYSVTFVFSVFSQFFLPAESAMIPALVGKGRLLTANSLFNLTFTLSQLVGIVFMAPIVIKFFGIETLFISIAVLMAVCGALVFTLPPTSSNRAGSPGEGARAISRFMEDLRETWAFVASDRAATLAMLILTSGATLSLITAMLAPRYMVTIVGIRADDTVYVLAPAGVGMALGAAIIGRIGRWLQKELLALAGVFVVALGLVLLGVVSPVWNVIFGVISAVSDPAALPRIVSMVTVVMAMAAFTGFALSMMIISSQTILQERAPIESRGRIFAAQIMLGNVASILPLVFVGQLADLIGVPLVLGLLGASMIVLGLASLRSYRGQIWGSGPGGGLTPR